MEGNAEEKADQRRRRREEKRTGRNKRRGKGKAKKGESLFSSFLPFVFCCPESRRGDRCSKAEELRRRRVCSPNDQETRRYEKLKENYIFLLSSDIGPLVMGAVTFPEIDLLREEMTLALHSAATSGW